MRIKGRLPAVETGPAAAEVPAGPADMPGLLGMLQDPQPALNLAIFLGRRRHPPSPIGLSNGMSRKTVDFYTRPNRPPNGSSQWKSDNQSVFLR